MKLGDIKLFTTTQEDKVIAFPVYCNEDTATFEKKDVDSITSADYINSFNASGEETELMTSIENTVPYQLNISDKNPNGDKRMITLSGNFKDAQICDNTYRVKLLIETEVTIEYIEKV